MPVKTFAWLCAAVALVAVAGPLHLLLLKVDRYLAVVASSFLLIVAVAVPIASGVHQWHAMRRMSEVYRGPTNIRVRSGYGTIAASVGLFLALYPLCELGNHVVDDEILLVVCSLLLIVALSLLVVGILDLLKHVATVVRR
jgi:hypothetical protein